MRMLLTFFALISQIIAYGQPSQLPNPEAFFSAIIVSNMDTSLAWYTSNMGFEVVLENENEDYGFRQVNLRRGDLLIELLQINSALAPADVIDGYTSKTKLTGFFKFGVQVENFDGWLSHLEKSKVNFHGSVVNDPVTGQRMVIVRDPDGNRIQFFEKKS